jgi:hypothetical protein
VIVVPSAVEMRQFGGGFVGDAIAHPPQEHTDLYGKHPLFLGADSPSTPPTCDWASLLPKVGGIRNQGQTEACVPFTFVEVLALAAVGQGLYDTLELSPSLAYLGTLLETNRQSGLPPNTPLQPVGTQPTMCVSSLARMGVGLEAVRPFSQDPNVLLAPETIAQAGDASSRIALAITAYALMGAAAGAGRILAVCQGISAYKGSAIPCALSVDAAFNNCDGSSVLLAPDMATYSGGHMTSLAGYATVVSTEMRVSSGVITPYAILSNDFGLKDPSGSLRIGDTCARCWNHWSTGWASESDVPGTAWGGPAFINSLAWMYLVSATLAPQVKS